MQQAIKARLMAEITPIQDTSFPPELSSISHWTSDATPTRIRLGTRDMHMYEVELKTPCLLLCVFQIYAFNRTRFNIKLYI